MLLRMVAMRSAMIAWCGAGMFSSSWAQPVS
jgi:hypothetical protein